MHTMAVDYLKGELIFPFLDEVPSSYPQPATVQTISLYIYI